VSEIRRTTARVIGDIKPGLGRRPRQETITHYLEKYAATIIEKKKASMGPGGPLLLQAAEAQPA
jgi:hypothetical protein